VSASAPRPAARGFPVLLALGVVAALAILSVAGLRSYRHLAAQHAEERRLEQSIADTEERLEALRRRIRRLRDDPVTWERLAREELGLVRPGELVVVFPDDAVPPPPAAR
jgi:cell division protein FtsB